MEQDENLVLTTEPESVAAPEPTPADNDAPVAADDPVREEASGGTSPENENEENIDENEETDTEETQLQDDGMEVDPDAAAEDDDSASNVTVIFQADTDATYNAVVVNPENEPVPVLVTGSLIEKEPGIMDKRLEDYSVAEALLLLILVSLWLRMLFDYLGRRKT